MNKKAISPLIATVLIVGFTIVLAVVVINWVQNLTSDVTSKVSCESEANSLCRNLPPIPVSFTDNSGDVKGIISNVYSRNLTFLIVTRDTNGEILYTGKTTVINGTAPTLTPLGPYAPGEKISYTLFLPLNYEGTECEITCKTEEIILQ